MQSSPSSSMRDDDFEVVKARFIAAGDTLTDLQLLDLANCYHTMLRQRRAIRARHPSLAPTAVLGIADEHRMF